MKQTSRRNPSRTRDGSPGKPVPAGLLDVVVERLGEGGDGIAETSCGRLYIPLSLPGERVSVRPLRPRGDGFVAQVVEVLVPAGARRPPPCPHFGVCGGCAVQHMAGDAYAAWKTARLTAALARVGLGGGDLVAPLVRIAPGSRRRATFAAFRARAGGVHLGFQVREGHAVVDLATCLVLDPAIVALLPPLRRLFGAVLAPGGRASATVTLADGGLDVLLTGAAPRSLHDHERLARFAEDGDLARLSWRAEAGTAAEPLAVRRPVRVLFGEIAVALPPAGFLQPSLAGESALLACVRAGIGGAAGVIADLFCGCGTFALPLAQQEGRVHAIDADAEAIAALSTASRSAPAVAARLRCAQRDLFTRPLAAAELARFAAVVLDPPRAGARAQAAALAASAVPVVVYVSCNPATFARDARLLADGGYRLERVSPVDQFVWSPHLELVAVFRRAAAEK